MILDNGLLWGGGIRDGGVVGGNDCARSRRGWTIIQKERED